jgi:hypothetical protein
MLKEYYVVGRYLAQIPESKDMTEFIITQIESELRGISPNQLKGYLNGLFSVIEGEVIEDDEEEE